MDISLEILDLRAEAESMMTDIVRITRNVAPGGTPTLDPTTGTYPSYARTVVYVGKGLMRVPGTVSTGKVRPSAGDRASLLLGIFAIPVHAPAMAMHDVVTFTASDNPALIGLAYTVIGLLPASHVTKQRAAVELVAD